MNWVNLSQLYFRMSKSLRTKIKLGMRSRSGGETKPPGALADHAGVTSTLRKALSCPISRSWQHSLTHIQFAFWCLNNVILLIIHSNNVNNIIVLLIVPSDNVNNI